MEEIIKVPLDRVGVVIGPQGKTKSKIMRLTKTLIEIDSHEGEVTISGEGEDFFKGQDIVKAIARGFSPEKAFYLLKPNYLLKIILIKEFVGKNASAQKAKRGRIIGRDGLIRVEIEKKTNSFISVYGKTISIIARIEDLKAATSSVEMLLQGAKHDSLHHYLEMKDSERFEL
jgi:ribosomal RNA assembly protein